MEPAKPSVVNEIGPLLLLSLSTEVITMARETDYFGDTAPAFQHRDQPHMGRSFVANQTTAGRQESAGQTLLDGLRLFIASIVREEIGKREDHASHISQEASKQQANEILRIMSEMVGTSKPQPVTQKRAYTMTERARAARGIRDKKGRFISKKVSRRKSDES